MSRDFNVRATKKKTATLAQVLEYMDGPQAVLLNRGNTSKIAGVAIEKEGYTHPFFGAEISLDQWERYRRGLMDFRSLFMIPRHKAWYIFDLSRKENGEIILNPATRDENSEENYIPESGFFSYDHSEPIISTRAEELATQRYETDGIWDLPDFTQFYNKLNDLYVFFLSLEKYTSDATPQIRKRSIRDAFSGHPLRGGSSYVNLYHDLAAAQELSDRISVGKLRYASQGEVDVEGKPEVFSHIEAALAQFVGDYDGLKNKYDQIYKYLSKSKLLKADAEIFDPNGSIAKYIKSESDNFAEILNLRESDLIYELTDRHSLRFAKILLSYFRRVERYFLFFVEGRVKADATTAGVPRS
jgi:hypothetical protein